MPYQNLKTQLIFLLSLAIWGCEESAAKKKDAAAQPASRSPWFVFEGKAFESDVKPPPSLDLTTAPNHDTLMAMIGCECSPRATGAFFQRLSVTRGPLPQALVPDIRKQIRDNPALSILDALPGGISDLLRDVFANDEKIATQVRTGLKDKIAAALPGGTTLDQSLPFRFDGFATLGGDNLNSFSLEALPLRWALIVSTPTLWERSDPMAFGDHGLQVLETMRLLVEWKYLFGLDNDDSGRTYGGLTVDLRDGGQSLSGPYDPRNDGELARFFNGRYTISFPNASSIDLATNVQESWALTPDRVSLPTQARVWLAAAKVFARLRPESRRGDAAPLFRGQPALFPEDAHQLALAFLPGMQALLKEAFTDPERRQVRETASGGANQATLASVLDLLQALTTWSIELSDLSQSGIPEKTATKLGSAPAQLLPAVQLGVHNVLKNYTEGREVNSRRILEIRAEPHLIARAISVLAEIEQTLAPSPLLREKVVALFHTFTANHLAPSWEQNSIDIATMLWADTAFRKLAAYDEISKYDWFAQARDKLTKLLAKWDRRHG